MDRFDRIVDFYVISLSPLLRKDVNDISHKSLRLTLLASKDVSALGTHVPDNFRTVYRVNVAYLVNPERRLYERKTANTRMQKRARAREITC